MSSGSLERFAHSEPEAQFLATRGEEIVGYGIAALLNTFSRRSARRRLESFGLSRTTSLALIRHIEEDAEIRKDLAARLLGRAKISGFICLAAIALAFVPAMPWIYVGAIGVGGVYGVFSLIGWKRYSRPFVRR